MTELANLHEELKVQTAKAKRLNVSTCFHMNQPSKRKKNAKDAEIVRLQAELKSLRTGRIKHITDPPGVQVEYRNAELISILDTELIPCNTFVVKRHHPLNH